MDLNTERFPTRLWGAAIQIILILLPFAVFAFVVHALEQFMSRRLSERFGWNSVLVTGWLGTPIHELSHAAMCIVFGHKVTEIALFTPDPNSPVLGYVTHSFTPGNWYQEIGNFFIGIAPLIGGTLVLTGLLWLFFPSVARHMIEAPKEASSNFDFGESFKSELPSKSDLASATAPGPVGEIVQMLQAMFADLFAWENLRSWKLWLFLYLVLCVTTHMAPSGQDYRGATRGAIFCGIVLAVVWLIAAAIPGLGTIMLDFTRALLVPVAALLSLAIVLCLVSSALVWLITFGWDVLRGG